MKRSAKNRRKALILGSGAVVEPGAIAGYRSVRPLADRTLRIGPGSLIRAGSVIYEGSVIGGYFETGHGTVIREGNIIGDGCCVWSHSVVDYNCTIRNRVRIHNGVYICQYSRLEDGVFVGPGTVFLNSAHPGCEFERQCMKGPIVMKGAKIGGGCVIFPFVTIGKGAIVGAGSVIAKDVAAGKVVFGSPARVRGNAASLRCRTGHTLRPYPDRR